MKTPFALAWENFKATADASVFDPNTLATIPGVLSSTSREFLENRLHRAFSAGWTASELASAKQDDAAISAGAALDPLGDLIRKVDEIIEK